MKLSKKEVGTKLTIEQVVFRKRYTLILDRSRCKGCDLCKTVCPKEAIKLVPQPSVDGKARHALVDIDPEKCIYCGMCFCICPFGALEILIGGEPLVPVEKSESFPRLIKEIEMNVEKCDPNCRACMDDCPLAINLHLLKRGYINLCPCCTKCLEVCEAEGALRVTKIFNGMVKIHQEKCPEGCRKCLDVCPVNALHLDDQNKVRPDNNVCVYCKACQNVCPVGGALEVYRTSIRHTPVKSGAWNKALEKLTSVTGLAKELRTKSSKRSRQSVVRRFYPKRVETG